MKEIPLSHGAVTIVDDADFKWLTQSKWSASSGLPGRTYAVRSFAKPDGRRGMILMHREIMRALPGLCVDHINHDPLDNRRVNLRICTVSQNLMNQRIQKRKKSSRYKGVYWHPRRNKWYAHIKQDGQDHHLGVFDDEHEAAAAYNKEASRLFGEFALLNEITGG